MQILTVKLLQKTEANVEYREIIARLDAALGVGRSFDVTKREFSAARGSAQASFYSVAGLCDGEAAEKMIRFAVLADSPKTCMDSLPHPDVMLTDDIAALTSAVISGRGVLAVEGADKAAVIDIKSYPLRSVDEPENDKVLRGPRDGFGESLVRNTALIRRRLRDPKLITEKFTVGDPAQCDVVMCYVDGKAPDKLVSALRKKLSSLKTEALNMSQQSLAECLIKTGWYNPFPKVRYTERPDTATACVMEGDVLLLIDNTPAVMIFPVSILRFAEEINDYYFPPLVGSYLRIVRLVVLFLTIFVTPLWYLLVKSPDTLHENLHFLLIEGECPVPLILQLLLVELIIDVLKLASLNTPDVLGNSFSMLGALILGDFAVQSRWLVPEVLVYMAFVAIANFTQHSFEMSYACKLCRMALLVMIWLFDWWGFALGIVGILVLIATTKPLVGRGYLYPLIPYDGKKLRALLHRRPISRENT